MGIPYYPYFRPEAATRLGIGAATLIALAAAVGCAGHAPHLVETVPAVSLSEPMESAEATPSSDDELPVIHLLQKGQTLWRVARLYEVDLEELKQANGIVDVTNLEVGQSIMIPGARSPRPPADPGLWTWPVHGGRVLSSFGAPRRGYRHTGVDIGSDHGTPVLAARSGRVTYSGSGMRGYGKTVILDHGAGVTSLYAHNSSLYVRVGDRVDRGQRITRVGRTGNASTDHCHFEIREREVPVNPLRHIAPLVGAAR